MGIISILQYLSGGSLGRFYTCVNYAFYFLDKQSFTIRVDVFRCRCVLQCNLFTVSHPPRHTHTQVLTLTTQNAHWVFFHCWQGGQLGTMIVCSFAAHFRMLSVETVWLEEEESSDGPVLAQDKLWVAFLSGQMDRTMHPAPHCMQRLPGCFSPPSPSLPSCFKTTFKGMKGAENVWRSLAKKPVC